MLSERCGAKLHLVLGLQLRILGELTSIWTTQRFLYTSSSALKRTLEAILQSIFSPLFTTRQFFIAYTNSTLISLYFLSNRELVPS